MNKNILPAAVAFLLTTGTLFAAEKTMVKEADETRAPKVLSALKKFDTLLEKNAYDVKFFTLKEESQCENPVVFLNGLSGYCGSAGCTLLVLDCTDDGYRVMGKTTVSNRPVSLSATSTKGYRDIKVRVKNEGIVALKYGGKAYITNASNAEKSKKESSDLMIFDEITQATQAPAPKGMHPSWDVDKDGVNDCEKDGTCDDSVNYSLPRGTDVVSYRDNFYKAVNREWLASHEIDPEYGQSSNFVDVTKKIDAELKAIIERLDKADKLTSDEQKIIDYYHSCIDVDYRNKIGIAPLKEGLEIILSAKTHDDIAAIFAEYQKIGVNIPINLDVAFDKKDSKKFDIFVMQSGVALDKDKYTSKDKRAIKELKYYRQYITDILTLAKVDNVSNIVNDYIKVESKLAEIQLDVVGLKNLIKVYKIADFKKLNSILSNINLERYLKVNGIKQSETFTIEQEDYLKAFNEAFIKIDVEVWKSYLIAKYIGKYGASTITEFNKKSFEYNKNLGLVKKRQSLEDRTLSITNQNLGMLLAKLYIKYNFNPKSKIKAKELIDNIIAQYRITISKSTLFSEKTKKKALIKLDKMVFHIGYPDKWQDYSSLKIDKHDYIGNNKRVTAYNMSDALNMLGKPLEDTKWLAHPPQVVNASYNSSTNQFVILAGILNKPFFDLNASDAYNYGAIGMVIAHERFWK